MSLKCIGRTENDQVREDSLMDIRIRKVRLRGGYAPNTNKVDIDITTEGFLEAFGKLERSFVFSLVHLLNDLEDRKERVVNTWNYGTQWRRIKEDEGSLEKNSPMQIGAARDYWQVSNQLFQSFQLEL